MNAEPEVPLGSGDQAQRTDTDAAPDLELTQAPAAMEDQVRQGEGVVAATQQRLTTPVASEDGRTVMREFSGQVLPDTAAVSVSSPSMETVGPAPARVTDDAWRPPGAPLAPAVDEPVVHIDLEKASVVDEPVDHIDLEQASIMDEQMSAAPATADARRRHVRFPRPPWTRVLTVANQKGGVGKTTTTVNVAAALAQAGLRVLVLDIDPQGNASTALGIEHHAEIPSLYDVVVEDMPLADVVQTCPDIENLWCAPATIDLAGAEIELVSFVARETRLKRALETFLRELAERGDEQIDYVLIDCPPSLSLLTVNAFVAAREVLIPIQCEYYALEGLSQLLKHIELIHRQLNPKLHVSTIMLTMYDGRTRLSAQVADEVRNHFPDQVVKTTVPRSVRISEAPSHGQTVITYDPASSGALSYLEASRELAEQVVTWESTKREEQS